MNEFSKKNRTIFWVLYAKAIFTKFSTYNWYWFEQIIFLKHHAECKWVVENVKPYYEPLIKPDSIIQRHYFWSNFFIPDFEFLHDNIRTAQIPDLEKHHWFDLSKYKLPNKRQILRNCVYPKVWKYILELVEKYDSHP